MKPTPLQKHTCRLLADLLAGLGEAERKIEVSRQVVVEHLDFEPYAVFTRLDRKMTEALSQIQIGGDDTAIGSLDDAEEQVQRLIDEEQGKIEIICEYCGERREFDSIDIERVFAENVVRGPDVIQ